MYRIEAWCAREDLNLHALRHWLLKPACLPFHHSRVERGYFTCFFGKRLVRRRHNSYAPAAQSHLTALLLHLVVARRLPGHLVWHGRPTWPAVSAGGRHRVDRTTQYQTSRPAGL